MSMRIPQPQKFPGVVFHDDVSDFALTVDKSIDSTYRQIYNSDRDSAFSWPASLKLALEGTTDGVDEALALVEQLTLDTTGNVQRWVPSYAGAFPIVAEFLANSPTCMRRRTTEASEVAPLTVWVGSACSGGTSRAAYRKRGIVLMALVMMLIQQGRPVRLMIHTDDEGMVNGRVEYLAHVFEVNTRPLNMGLAMFALSGQQVEFTITYLAVHALQHAALRWPSTVANRVLRAAGHTQDYSGVDFHQVSMLPEWIAYMAEAFGGSVDDLWIPPPHLASEITLNPLGWLKAKLAQYGSQHTGDY